MDHRFACISPAGNVDMKGIFPVRSSSCVILMVSRTVLWAISILNTILINILLGTLVIGPLVLVAFMSTDRRRIGKCV